MADVILTVGAEFSIDYSQFQSQITQAISKIELQTQNIKVGFDANSIKSMQSQLQALYSSAGTSSGSASSSAAATAAAKSAAQASKEAASAAKQQATAERELASAKQQRANTESQSTAASKQASKADNENISVLKQYYTTITQLENALKKYTAAKTSMSSSSRSAYSNIQNEATNLKSLFATYDGSATSINKMKTALSQAQVALKANTSVIQANNDATKSWIDRMSGLSAKFTSWLTVSQFIMVAIRSIRQMITASIDLEDAMAQLQIVTKATDEEMTAFFTESVSLAKELGQSITDIAGSIETFARLGYSFEDSSSLAEYATILSNVANTDVDTATTGLTSIIKGYSLEASDAERIADILVTVGQEYAISAEELMEAFERGGAALSATGATVEQSAALFAATNASLQNASSTGTMWKTVSARIRGATTELEELGESSEDCADGISKYRDEVKALTGVDIMVNDNTYKDIYDIFVELAEVWDDLSDTSQARVSEILGGTRQLSGISSTITNISDAIGAYESAMDSAGAATEANDIYMQTTTAHIGQFKAAFQELSSDLFDSNMIKGFVDLGTNVITVLDKIISTLGSIPTLIAAVTAGLSIKKDIGRDKKFSLKLLFKYADCFMCPIR